MPKEVTLTNVKHLRAVNILMALSGLGVIVFTAWKIKTTEIHDEFIRRALILLIVA
jgi:hypothetical protein